MSRTDTIPYQVGDIVYDRPSKRIAKIIAIDDGQFFTLDDSVPLDATNDGAFPDRCRNDFELLQLTDPRCANDVDWNY